MRIRPTLLLVLLRGPLFVALPFACALLLAVLLPKTILSWHDQLPLVLLIVLAIAFGYSLGGSTHRHLVTRGYSSDCIWAHALVAGLLSLLVALTPAALLLWLGLRGEFQESVRDNPLFPLMAPVETYVPFAWLTAGLFLFPAALFARIRASQPTENPAAGPLLFAILALALFSFFHFFPRLNSWQYAFALGVGLLITLTLLFTSRFLHRTLEFPQ